MLWDGEENLQTKMAACPVHQLTDSGSQLEPLLYWFLILFISLNFKNKESMHCI